MATKSGILATINGFITAIITQAKVRSAYSAVIDEVYPVSITDANTTEVYTTKVGTNLLYYITIVKSGNIAHISGGVRNATTSSISLQNVFTWKVSQFKPKVTVSDLYFKAYYNNTGGSVTLFLSDAGLYVKDAMPPGSFYYTFEFITYITQD